jgi:hypothetical protein
MTKAELVVLRKAKRFAPEFHRHMLPGRIRGQVVKVGDKVLVYEVEETVPEGPVEVTDSTKLEVR